MRNVICVVVLSLSGVAGVAPSRAAEDGRDEKTIKAILADGVFTHRDDKLPGRPVVKITITDTHPMESLTPATLARIRKLRSVRIIEGTTTRIGDAVLASLLSLPELKEVRLVQSGITDHGLQQLSRHPSLRLVSLFGCWLVTDEGVRHLAKMRRLEELEIESMGEISDAAFKPFASLPRPRLRSLEVAGTGVTDRGIGLICSIRSLETLRISRTAASPRCLPFILRARRLKYVLADSTEITRADVIKVLGKVPNIRVETGDDED
jgi:hypothetical protein